MEQKKQKQRKPPQNPPLEEARLRALTAEVKRLAKMMAEQAPAAISGPNPVNNRKPKVKTGKGCVQVDHAELFIWPDGQASFTVDGPSVNPGHPYVFPWLSQVARAFETYEFRYLRFKFYPRCGTGQAGTVYLALDPKSGDDNPASESILATYHIRTQGSMWKEHVLNIPKAVLHAQGPKRFISPGDIQDDNVRSLYDVGNFLLATIGASPAGGKIGEVSVEYGVDLCVPAQNPQGNVNSGWVNAGGTTSIASPFGTAPTHGGYLIADVESATVFLEKLDHNAAQDMFYDIWFQMTGTGFTGVTVGVNPGSIISNQLVVINAAATQMAFHARIKMSYGYITFLPAGTTLGDTLFNVYRVCPDQSF